MEGHEELACKLGPPVEHGAHHAHVVDASLALGGFLEHGEGLESSLKSEGSGLDHEEGGRAREERVGAEDPVRARGTVHDHPAVAVDQRPQSTREPLLGMKQALALPLELTEAAVGAGISTVLFLGTLALTRVRTRERTALRPGALLIVVLTGAALIFGTLDMPHYGDPNAPAHRHPRMNFVERTENDIDVDNVVTAVLGSYRGYDTLGETVVIFTAGVAVPLLLRRRSELRVEQESEAESAS